ncbi:sigma-70 family RNA polymerase sigma factor [Paracidobacterium acidisoli]|nr:sigma-70 family RNA polymerase sigma factor [Paracidobacterium acidisoli]
MGLVAGHPETELIASILAGERDRFHDLIRPYERRIYLTAFSVVKNEAEAEDIVQEAVLRAYRKLASFRGESKFGTWLTAITLNEARLRLRRSKSALTDSLDERTEDGAEVTPAVLTDWREVPLAALERGEIRLLLQEAIASLPETFREVVILRDMEEMNVSETAQALGISISLVKVRLHRARLMLQKILVPKLRAAIKPERRSRWRWPWS